MAQRYYHIDDVPDIDRLVDVNNLEEGADSMGRTQILGSQIKDLSIVASQIAVTLDSGIIDLQAEIENILADISNINATVLGGVVHISGAETITGLKSFSSGLNTDTINEYTEDAGVTVDGVLIKNGLVDGVDVSSIESTVEAYTDSAISTEVVDRNSAVSTAISSEVVARNSADSTVLSTAEAYADSEVSAEVVNRNSAISASLSTAEAYTDSAISTEVVDRNSAISTAISSEVVNRNSAVSTAISTEVVNRNSAISTAISTEVVERNSADSTVLSTAEAYTDSKISTEVVDRNSAISTAISSEVVARNSADSTVLSTAEAYTDGATSTTLVEAKAYTDALAVGLNVHNPVRVATADDTPLPACTYAPGSDNAHPGVGATLTGNADGALVIDGVSVVADDRVLIKDQVDKTQNGIYDVTQAGDSTHPFILTRSLDYDGSPQGEVANGDFFLVTEGNTEADEQYVLISPNPDVVGTSDLVFALFSRVDKVIAGDGLKRTGNTLDIDIVDITQAITTVNDNDLLVISEHTTDTIKKITKGNLFAGIATDSGTSAAISTAVSTAEAYTDSAVSTEVVNRNSAISTAISTEVVNRNSADSTVLSTAEAYTDSAISTEVVDRNSAVSTAISSEVVARNSAISTAISTEVTNRNDAISTAISSEVIARDSADSTVLSTAEAYTDSAISTEVVNRNSADSTVLSTAEAYTDSAISTEVVDRNSAISTAISSEVVNRNSAVSTALSTAEAYTDSAISTEVVNRNSAVSTALSAAEAYADSAISTAIGDIPTPHKEAFTASADQTLFTLANTPVVGSEDVFLNGLLNVEGSGADYTISGSAITFTYGLQAGEVVVVKYLS